MPQPTGFRLDSRPPTARPDLLPNLHGMINALENRALRYGRRARSSGSTPLWPPCRWSSNARPARRPRSFSDAVRLTRGPHPAMLLVRRWPGVWR